LVVDGIAYPSRCGKGDIPHHNGAAPGAGNAGVRSVMLQEVVRRVLPSISRFAGVLPRLRISPLYLAVRVVSVDALLYNFIPST
jgi:hypothetical protein